METVVDEIADNIYRISTYVPSADFTFNQFLIRATEPLLFHCGPRAMFPLVAAAVGKLIPVSTLRWISFGHHESDESGSVNEWLEAAPKAQVAVGEVSCMISMNDIATRPPMALADGAKVELGGKRSAIWRLLTCRIAGMRASCMKKPHAPCCAGISLGRSANTPRSVAPIR